MDLVRRIEQLKEVGNLIGKASDAPRGTAKRAAVESFLAPLEILQIPEEDFTVKLAQIYAVLQKTLKDGKGCDCHQPLCEVGLAQAAQYFRGQGELGAKFQQLALSQWKPEFHEFVRDFIQDRFSLDEFVTLGINAQGGGLLSDPRTDKEREEDNQAFEAQRNLAEKLNFLLAKRSQEIEEEKLSQAAGKFQGKGN